MPKANAKSKNSNNSKEKSSNNGKKIGTDLDDSRVANVNKSFERQSRSKSRKTTDKRGRESSSQSSQNSQNVGRKRKKAGKSKIELNNSQREVSARFVEGDQVIQMTVEEQEQEDELFPGNSTVDESDSDTEVQLNMSQRSGENLAFTDEEEEGILPSSDEEMDVDNDTEQPETQVAMETGTTPVDTQLDQNKAFTSQERKLRLKQIDKEMKERIQELHNLMSEGGLDESAKLLMDLPVFKEKQQPLQIGRKVDAQKKQHAEAYESDKTEGKMETGDSGNFNDNANVNENFTKVTQSKSMDTIYDIAVPRRGSSSSEEELNVNSSDDSGETINKGIKISQTVPSANQIESFIADQRRKRQDDMTERDQPQPSTSSAVNRNGNGDVTADKVQDLIREAENAKARIVTTPGMTGERQVNMEMPTFLIDESYIVVGAHLDETAVAKIGRGEYVDFGKLIPRDRVLAEEDGRMEMFVKNGRTYWAPVSNSTNIHNFARWEQAFRVYSNIYCKINPNRAAEMIEYNHIIHTISLAYQWDNVYTYDKEFRLHMSRNPHRSWAIILQQAWSLRLRDRISFNQGQTGGHSQYGNNNRAKVNEPCRRFNRGRCNFGVNCRYEHKCLICNKFGHGAVTCRRATNDRNNRDQKPSGGGSGDRSDKGGYSHAAAPSVPAMKNPIQESK